MKHTFVLTALASALFFVGCRMNQPPLEAQSAPPAVVPDPPKPVEPKPDEPKVVPDKPIAVTLEIMQNVAPRGKVVGFSMTARNTTKDTQMLNFTSGQSFDIAATPEAAKDEKKEVVWRWSHDKIFTQALRGEKLAPGQAKTWSAMWNQTGNDDNPLPRGKYVIQAWITANGGLKAAPVMLELAD